MAEQQKRGRAGRIASSDGGKRQGPDFQRDRELTAFQLYVTGTEHREIAQRMGILPGSPWHAREYQVRELIRKALERRAVEAGPTVAAARALYVERLEKLVNAYLPRAVGAIIDPVTGLPSTPDLRAAEFVLKTLRDKAAVEGVGAPKEVNVNVRVEQPDDRRAAERKILADLMSLRIKHEVIEGELAEQGTGLDLIAGGVHEEHRPGPPPQLEDVA